MFCVSLAFGKQQQKWDKFPDLIFDDDRQVEAWR